MIKVIIHSSPDLFGRTFANLASAQLWLLGQAPTSIIPQAWEDS